VLSAEEQARPLKLWLVVFDVFKKITDGYGLPSGDRVLSEFAA
jgi:GGDEF domain-containing protein